MCDSMCCLRCVVGCRRCVGCCVVMTVQKKKTKTTSVITEKYPARDFFPLQFGDDDMVRYFFSQIENGHKSDSETHRRRDKPDTGGNGELAGNKQLRLIRSRKKKSVTYTVKQPGKGTRP